MADLNLRPMTLGEVLDGTFRLYKNNFWLFAGITALPFLVILLFEIIFAEVNNPGLQAGPAPIITPGNLAGIFGGAMILLFLYVLMTGYAHAATIFAVSDLYLARSATVRGSFARVGTKVFRILLIFLIIFLVFFGAVFVLAIVAGIIFALFKAPALLFVLLALAVIPAVMLFCRVAMAVPTAMLENLGAFRSLARSFQLTQGFTGQVFLIYLLAGFLMYSAILLFQWPFLGMSLKAAASHQVLPFGIVLFQHLGSFLCQVLVGPVGTIATSLMYYNLRVRKEAFDVQHLLNTLGVGASPSAPATN